MWEINNKLQIISLLESFALGVFFCVLYDFFKAYRLAANPKKKIVFFEDIAYFIICAIVTFCFLLSVTNGEIRGYVFVIAVLGFIVTRLTLSKLLIFILVAFFRLILRFSKALKDLTEKISKAFSGLFDRITALWRKIYKKIRKCFKKGLKKQ